MKKFIILAVLVLVGAGIYVGWKMAKGEGGLLGGWGGDQTDPWSTYTPPPADEGEPAA